MSSADSENCSEFTCSACRPGYATDVFFCPRKAWARENCKRMQCLVTGFAALTQHYKIHPLHSSLGTTRQTGQTWMHYRYPFKFTKLWCFYRISSLLCCCILFICGWISFTKYNLGKIHIVDVPLVVLSFSVLSSFCIKFYCLFRDHINVYN